MFANGEYRPIGQLCSWESLSSAFGSGSGAATTEAAAGEAATAMDAMLAGEATPAAAATTTAASAPGFTMPSLANITQGMQILNFLRNSGPAPQSTFTAMAPSTIAPTTAPLPGTGASKPEAVSQESWWRDLISGTGQGDKVPASIQENIDRQASLI